MRQRAGLSGAVLAAVCLAILIGGVSAAVAAVRVTLRPGTGGSHTGFVLRFRNPARTGTVFGVHRSDRIVVTGPSATGCVSRLSYGLRPARAGAAMRTVIRPGGGRHWCSGRFDGRLLAYQATGCTPGPGHACPLLLIAPQTLARFNFRVRTTSSGGTGGGGGSGGGGTGGGGSGGSGGSDLPSFAGLQTATTCSTTPVHGGHSGRIYTLSWNPASDPVTPPSQIVYDIYFSDTPGAENFASPTWTTQPGASAYSGTLATSGSAYFVVRARNQAGHEETNMVERLAGSNC